MFRKTVCIILVVLMLASLAIGCGQKKNDNPSTSTENTSTADTNVEQTKEEENEWDKMKEEEHELNITLIPGFLTDELWTELLDGFQKDHPKWKITREMNPEAGKQDQAKILSGNAPAFFQGDWVNFTAHMALDADVLADIEDLLTAPAYDTPGKTVEETMLPGFDKVLMKDGKRYTFVCRYGANGIWINKKMFEENGWEFPKTWNGFMDLCEKIKNKGITPLITTEMGAGAMYPFNMFVYPMICGAGNGQQTARDLANLVPGVWNGNNVRTALERYEGMYKNKYIPKDVLGTDYLQAQVLFFQGKAAMVLSGSWLEGEMKDQIPEGFEFEFMPVPSVDSADMDRTLPIFTVGFSFCRGAKQEKEAKELVRYWFSSKFMKSYAEKYGEPTITQNMVQLDKSKFSNAAWSIKKVVDDPTVKIIKLDFTSWYQSLHNTAYNGLAGIVAGNETTDTLLKKLEDGAEEIRNDNSIKKYTQE